MPLLFCVRPATRNIGNDAIARSVTLMLQRTFGEDVGIVNIPALAGPQFGGFTARQVYDMNRFADGVVLGGGNLFENGQLTVDLQAVAALRTPMMMIGLSHGRIYDRSGDLVDRTDSLSPAAILQLSRKSCVSMMRDLGSQEKLVALGAAQTQLGGCPTLYLEPPARDREREHDGRIIVSIRHPARMCVPPALQWRTAEHVRNLVDALTREYGPCVTLACHDYADIEFASGFPGTPFVYYDDVSTYFSALSRCRYNISYRLHAFLPCVAFGTPALHLSYDERGLDMVRTAGLEQWNVDLVAEADPVGVVLHKMRSVDRAGPARDQARSRIAELRAVTDAGLAVFRDNVLRTVRTNTLSIESAQ